MAQEGFSYEEMRIGVCHEIAREQPVVLGRRILSEADAKNDLVEASSEKDFSGYTVTSFNGEPVASHEELINEVRNWYYLSDDNSPVFTISNEAGEREVGATTCVEGTTDSGLVLIPSWVDWMARVILHTHSRVHLNRDGLWQPKLENGVVVIYEDKKDDYFIDLPDIKLYVTGPGELVAVHYFDSSATREVARYADAEGLNYKFLDNDGSRDFEKRLVVYYKWIPEEHSRNFLSFIQTTRTTFIDLLDVQLPVLKRNTEQARQRVEEHWKHCKRTTSSKDQLHACLRN